jgi:iron complex outermembrane receptor protein
VQLEKDRAFSPRVGVLYLIAPDTTAYASVSKSFGTNNGRSASGQPLDPQQAHQVEFGLKHQRPDGSLSATASIFRLTKSNLLTADLSTPSPDDQTTIGEVRHQGLELDVLGRPLPALNVMASYTFIDSEITRDNDGNQGHRMPNVPRHAASLWAKWSFADGARDGWEVGAGVYARSQREGDRANSWQLPGYARVDAMLRWRTLLGASKVAAQLNVENLFDRTYLDRGGSGGTGAKYGSPRALTLAVSVDL